MIDRVRAAVPEDLEGLAAIEDEADSALVDLLHPERWDPAPSGVERAAQPGFVLVAEVDGRVVGFAHVLTTAGWAHLEQLSVLPAHGRRGHGRALVEAAKERARAEGYRTMTLRTFADVPWNAPFYASAGFVEQEPSTDADRALVDVEARLGLDRLGRRVQMGVELLS
ncbi:GNAT family N-acetyltransferase [Curtobacterium sp. MCLR17_036]|uniref:GNAT family N-acetyltransferase n=1 Tax=Curtobacterium sp. MCLR17_036 TaxID=2175620 RepID=UPI000DA92661|nr:GNAT family N-acetyltransferase [Curtobacterium sp. MCLR17_036]WIE64073.1 GNAT family N-acetyltransferase [Curtobacterium sp. MCLR17_036]